MPKINVMYELEPNFFNDEVPDYKIKMTPDKRKNVKVSEKVFDLMLDEGLLRKTDDGYVFVGKYEDLTGKKKKKTPS
ncbi:MAG TPA: hypothetical protein VMY59_03025 [Candidatus Thermoplasmatota archaeon]|nr:hypothetical protein [Candidatus Thermoplasmatota archaeon]